MTLVKSLEGLVGARLAETKTSKQQLAERIGVNGLLRCERAGNLQARVREGQLMTTIVSEREEGSFLDYILELARKEMASSAGQSEDEATEVRPVSGGAK